MMNQIRQIRQNPLLRYFYKTLVLLISINLMMPVALAQSVSSLMSSSMVPTSASNFTPVILRGLKIAANNPFKFDFIVDTGDSKLDNAQVKPEALKLIKYFMAALTVPEKETWVNLSPYEKDRIIPENFGKTEMGRDLLAQDFMLKQITTALTDPQKDLGKKFWDSVYQKAQQLYGVTDIPVSTFNKVWIVPSKASILERDGVAYVVESHLKVMLEADYATMMHMNQEQALDAVSGNKAMDENMAQMLRELVVPAIEKEVNEGKNFANLRQIYHSMILAAWYKKNLRESILGEVYVDKNKVNGVDLADSTAKQKIYDQYVEAFKKGAFNYIKEDYDAASQSVIPRKYFSGGFSGEVTSVLSSVDVNNVSQAQLSMVKRLGDFAQNKTPDPTQARLLNVGAAFASSSMSAVISSENVTYGETAINAFKERKQSGDTNLAKKIGDIPHRDNEPHGFFSVNSAIEESFYKSKVTDLHAMVPDVEDQLANYLSNVDVSRTAMRVGIQDKVLLDLYKNTKILLVEDARNGSPAIVLRSQKDYQVAHVSLGRNGNGPTIYLGRGLVEKFLRDGRTDLLNLLLTREFIVLAKAKNVQETDRKYEKIVADAEKAAQDFEDGLSLGADSLEGYIQGAVNIFLRAYPEALKDELILWDFQSSLLNSPAGKSLVGGKSYQQATYWSADSDNNLRSFSGSTEASAIYLKSAPDLLPKINEILRPLDTSSENDRKLAYQKIRKMILAVPVPAEIAEALKHAYKRLVEVTGQDEVAVRSSGKAEDIAIKSEALKGVTLGANAGQHDTYLGVVGEDAVVEAWQKNVASLYTDRVLDYRDGIMVLTAFDRLFQDISLVEKIIEKLKTSTNKVDLLVAQSLEDRNIKIVTSLKLRDALMRNGFEELAAEVNVARETYFDIENIGMGVTIMPMADTRVSFVNFGHQMATGWTAMTWQNVKADDYKNQGRVVTITTNWGIGESIVQGKATPDTFLVHIFNDPDVLDQEGNPIQRVNILSRQLGTKAVQAVFTEKVKNDLGLKEEDIDGYLSFLETKKVPKEGLKGFRSNSLSEIGRFHEILTTLVKEKVDENDATLNSLTSADYEPLIGYNRGNLKMLAHLLKAMEEDRQIKTMFTDVPEVLRSKFSATDTQVQKIAVEFMRKAKGYGHLVDMEGTIGKNLGKEDHPITVQRRPSNVDGDVDDPDSIKISYTYVAPKDLKKIKQLEETVYLPDGRSSGLIRGERLIQGIPTRNAFSGMIYRIDESKDLSDQFEIIKGLADKGNSIIIRTKETTPDFVPVLKYKNVKGVIADVGGPTSHAAVVSRELGIATVVGIQTWMEKLGDKGDLIRNYLNTTGNMVTVDANASDTDGFGAVYVGELPISKQDIHIRPGRLPKSAVKIGYIMGMPHPMITVSKMANYASYSGVALMRGEFAYAEENINPRAGRAYDAMLAYDFFMIKRAKTEDEAKAYYNARTSARKESIDNFFSHLEHRESLRSRGVDVPQDRIERMVEDSLQKAWSPDQFKKRVFSTTQAEDIEKLRAHPDEIAKLTQQIKGYASYDEFFDAVHGGSVAMMAAANNRDNNTVVYRSIDFKQNEAGDLIGSRVFNPHREPATMVGERGARWLLQKENRVILQEEVRMLLRQVARGYVNIGFMFPFVSTPEELHQLLTILEDEERIMSKELGRPIYLREVGQMVELPSNVIQAMEFLDVLHKHEVATKKWFQERFGVEIKRKSFLSFGTNDLTQLTMGADRDGPLMKYLFNEAHPFVIESIRFVVAAAKKVGIKCGLCGQALVNLMTVNPEAAEEILLLLGSTGGYAGTDYLGTLVAVQRAASATLKNGQVDPLAAAGASVLAGGFVSNINRGAAARPFYLVQSQEEWKDTYVGDYVFVDASTKLDLDNEEIKKSISRLGALVYSDDGLDAAIEAIAKRFSILTVKIAADQVPDVLKVQDGNYMTIDFNNKKIYAGDLKININIPVVESKIKVPMKRASAGVKEVSFSGVFSSSKFYQDMGIHPLAFLAYDDAIRRQEIPASVQKTIADLLSQEGVTSGDAFLRQRIAKKLEANLPSKEVSSLVYETMDLQSDDLVALSGHELFLEEAEVNPPLGFAGLDALMRDGPVTKQKFIDADLDSGAIWSELVKNGYITPDGGITAKFRRLKNSLDMVLSEKLGVFKGQIYSIIKESSDGQWAKLFEVEMMAVKDLSDKGYNVSVQFNSVKVPESLEQAIDIMKNLGIDTQKVRLGMDTAWPGNYLFAKEFMKFLSFMTIDSRKLTQGYLAADISKNAKVKQIYSLEKNLDAYITLPKRMIEAAAKEMGIPVRGNVDAAMTKDLGGIDLNAQLLDLQVKRDGNGVPLPVSMQPIEKMNIQGLTPVIVTITPFNPVLNLSLKGENSTEKVL